MLLDHTSPNCAICNVPTEPSMYGPRGYRHLGRPGGAYDHPADPWTTTA